MDKQGLKDLMLFAKQRGIESVEEAVMYFDIMYGNVMLPCYEHDDWV